MKLDNLHVVRSLIEDENLIATHWEISFLQSIFEQLQSGKTLSDNQLRIVKRVTDKNSEEAREQARQWKSNWETDCAEKAKIVANYYLAATHYFPGASKQVLMGEPLSRELYQKMCLNKYAQKVLEEHYKAPRFETGSMVQVRANTSMNNHYFRENGSVNATINNMHAVVIETDALPVRRAALGAKVYRILPVGSTKAYYVSESDLKKAKKIK